LNFSPSSKCETSKRAGPVVLPLPLEPALEPLAVLPLPVEPALEPLAVLPLPLELAVEPAELADEPLAVPPLPATVERPQPASVQRVQMSSAALRVRGAMVISNSWAAREE
jgi:hypothetical protein